MFEVLQRSNIRERKELTRQIAEKGVECINDFYTFFKTFWPEFSGEPFVDNFHIKLICNTLQEYGVKIAQGEELRKTLIINVPPGSSKSSMCTVAYPLWMWLIKPSCTTVNISYSADVSKEHQDYSKNITASELWHSLFDDLLTLKYGKAIEVPISNKNKIQNNFGGKRFNTSTGGSITGRHADIIIEDDPLNPEQAHSDAERGTAIRFHDKTISTRKKNDNCYLNVIIAQRLHEEDVVGHVLKKKLDITHICLPGEITNSTIVEPSWAKKYYVDGILNPVRKGRKVLDDLKESLGDDYSTQVLQLPFDLEEQDIKPSMFRKIHEKELPGNIIWDLFIDGAYTEKTENDPTGIMIAARHGNDIIIKANYNVKKKLPDLMKFLIELENTGQFDAVKSRIFVEPKASGHSLVQYIENDTDYNYVLIGSDNKIESKLVQEGKVARHKMIQPKAESRRIVVVDDTWTKDFITDICGFPRAANDEAVDNLGYAINHYYMKENTFVEQWAINRLEDNIPGSINITLTSSLNKYRINTEFKENDKGDIQLFEYPSKLYKHRYICVLTLQGGGERPGKTCILILDRQTMTIPALYVSNDIQPHKAGKKAYEMATLFENAHLVVGVRDEVGTSQTEDYDLSHLALNEILKVQYDNLHYRLTVNDIRMKREREYGFEINRSTSREVYYNLKDMIESDKVSEIPMEVLDEIKLLERKKDTGEIDGREGYKTNCALAYSISLKVNEEMYDKVVPRRKSGRFV